VGGGAPLRDDGVTIILTTHYIEEAEEMADRIGVINKGRLLLVEDKRALMQQFGRKHLTVELVEPLSALPAALADRGLTLSDDGMHVGYAYDTRAERSGITRICWRIRGSGHRGARPVDPAEHARGGLPRLVEENA
jgi:ABC-2 type transport system ATP-binding protein